ncbi:HAD-IIB family hydrolase [Oceanobacillus sp. CFH 90083]|uniref:HAD-IIB family hydrolase n=1 Tax=Oceanobacillus sp. CFH 90083 TaxID=2592336 RepID=UPI001883562A|nr:HAD-IIB family hydrolase [Oceanobacillus sp. CFH 90083]
MNYDGIKRLGIKNAAFDLDGTIITDNNRVIDGVLRGLESLKKNGITNFIVTGRGINLIKRQSFIRKFEPFIFPKLILNDGNIIYSLNSNKLYILNTINKNYVIGLYNYFKNKADFIIESRGIPFAQNRKSLMKYKMIYNIQTKIALFSNITELENITKIYIFPQKGINRVIEDNMLNNNLFIVNKISFLNCYEIKPPFISKDIGLEHLLRICAMGNLNNVVSFGDGMNDKTLLNKSKLGIAVMNCEHSVSEICDVKLSVEIGEFLLSL